MLAFQAARRITPLILVLILLVAAPLALADDDSRGYLGVTLQDISPSMARALQLEDDNGILVNEVIEDSPADEAGLEDGDVILEYDGKPIDSNKALTRAVRDSRPGDLVEVVVLREGRRRTLDVEVGEHEDSDLSFYFQGGDGLKHLEHLKHLENLDWIDENSNVIIMSDDDEIRITTMNDDRGFLGVHLDDLNEQLGDYFEVEDGDGALVTTIVEDSPAEQAGLMAGDVIVALDGETIESAADVHEFMTDTEVEQDIEVEVVRKGRPRTITVTSGEAPENSFTSLYRSPRSIQRVMRIGDKPQSRHMLIDIDDKELEVLKEELEILKEELEELREDLKDR